MTEEQVVQIIRQELAFLLKQNKLVFDRPMQILDGNDIQLGRTNGTRIGKADQKLSVYGVTPVVQQGAISSPSSPSGVYVQSEATSAKTAIDALRVALTNFGITL